MSIDRFDQETRTFKGETRVVYYRRTGGPGVVLLHEIPGITPQVATLGTKLADAGFSVAMPSLFGEDGAPYSVAVAAEVALKMCVSREFAVFAANGSSPIVDWLRALCIDFHAETKGIGVGAIGLCITGGFALSLTVGTGGIVKAPVMSEPSLPFALPHTENDAAMHLTDAEKQAIAAQTAPPVVALRFTGDWICPKRRFDSYQTLLGGRLTRIEIPSPHLLAHAVLTNDFQLDAFNKITAFLNANLR